MYNIKGFQPITLVDFPNEVAAIIFLGGCNLRCSFCHNPELVLSPRSITSIDFNQVMKYLNKRKGMLDGVVITGGEPCLNKDLIHMIKEIKSLGLKVKLDTNGTMPKVLEEVLPHVDYVAMDIKSSLNNYSKASGVNIDLEKVKKSVDLIRSKAKNYEFRTTLVRNFVGSDDIKEICEWLGGSRRYVLQQFNKGVPLLGDVDSRLYTKEEINGFADICQPNFEHVEVRNI